MDYIEFQTLWKLVESEGVVDEVAEKLKIKKSSLRRQVNRIIAYHTGKAVQKRSGKKTMARYSVAMRSVIEKKLGRPVLTGKIETPRQVIFNNLKDALEYSKPISHISTIQYDWETNSWRIRISKGSDNLPPVDYWEELLEEEKK